MIKSHALERIKQVNDKDIILETTKLSKKELLKLINDLFNCSKIDYKESLYKVLDIEEGLDESSDYISSKILYNEAQYNAYLELIQLIVLLDQ